MNVQIVPDPFWTFMVGVVVVARTAIVVAARPNVQIVPDPFWTFMLESGRYLHAK